MTPSPHLPLTLLPPSESKRNQSSKWLKDTTISIKQISSFSFSYLEAPVAQLVERLTTNPTNPAGRCSISSQRGCLFGPPVHPAVMGSWSL